MSSLAAMIGTIDVNNRRQRGLSDDQIALDMHLSLHAIKSVPLPRPQPQRQRATQALQLQVALQQLMPAVEEGDREAIALMLKVQQREANLLGLDAPKEVINHNFTEVDEIPTSELKRMVQAHLEASTIDVTPERVSDSDPTAAQGQAKTGDQIVGGT